MIAIGKHHKLDILTQTSEGLLLGYDENETVLLPIRFCEDYYDIGDSIEVFVYVNSEQKKIATTTMPTAILHEFGFLKVTAVTDVGTFMDWGMEDKIMVPFKQQRQQMEEGRWYVVFIDIDPETNRLIASNKIEKHLQNDKLTVTEGDEVELLVYSFSELGFAVIVNHLHKGLIYKNETFQPIHVGDQLQGYVRKIRADGKLDISLQPIGYRKFNSKNSDEVYTFLVDNDGFLPVNDKSDPALIYKNFGFSKKAFKKAIGDLYKQRIITIDSDGIRLIED